MDFTHWHSSTVAKFQVLYWQWQEEHCHHRNPSWASSDLLPAVYHFKMAQAPSFKFSSLEKEEWHARYLCLKPNLKATNQLRHFRILLSVKTVKPCGPEATLPYFPFKHSKTLFSILSWYRLCTKNCLCGTQKNKSNSNFHWRTKKTSYETHLPKITNIWRKSRKARTKTKASNILLSTTRGQTNTTGN